MTRHALNRSVVDRLDTVEQRTAAALSAVHPRLGATLLRGRDDLERGEVTVATVMWASMVVLMAAALGVILWNKVRDKGNAIDLDAPASGVGR